MGLFGINLPSISLPKIALPSLSLPSLPKITLPSLPKVTLPSLPKISLPVVSLPKVSLPSLPAISLPAGMQAGTKAAQKFMEEQAQRARWAAEAAAEAAADAGRTVSSIPTVSVPKVELPKVSLPTVSIPKVTLPVLAGGITLPEIPKVTLPTVALPKVELPKLPDLPKAAVALPAAVAGAGVSTLGWVTSGNAPELPDLSQVPGLSAIAGLGASTLGAVQQGAVPKLPDIGGAFASLGSALPPLPKIDLRQSNGTAQSVSGLADTVIDARDKNYEDGITRVIAGENNAEKVFGAAQFGSTAAVDVLLPLDLMNVTNKMATGRGGELTGDDYLWAAVDAGTIALGVVTGGIGYGVGRAAIKGGKLGLKATKGGSELFKLSSIASAAKAAASAKSATAVRAAAAARQAAAIKASQVAAAARAAASAKAAAAAKASAQAKTAAEMRAAAKAASEAKAAQAAAEAKALEAAKAASEVKVASEARVASGAQTLKLPEVSKSGSLGKSALYAVAGAGVGYMGLQALGALGSPAVGGGGEVPYTDPYSTYDPFAGLGGTLPYSGGASEYPGGPWYDGGDYPYTDPSGGLPPEYVDPGYVPPEYPGGEYFAPAEYFAQDVGGFLEGLPVVGDLFAAANERGLALPLLLGCCLAIGGGGYYVATRTQAGKSAVRTVKGVVGA